MTLPLIGGINVNIDSKNKSGKRKTQIPNMTQGISSGLMKTCYKTLPVHNVFSQEIVVVFVNFGVYLFHLKGF